MGMSHLKKKWFVCFQGQGLSLISYFHLFYRSSQALSILNRDHIALNLENHWKICVWPIFCFPKSTFNDLKIYIAFLHLVAKVYAHTCCSYKLATFLGVLELQMEQYTFVFNKALCNKHICFSVVSSRKWFSRDSFVCTYWKKFSLAVVSSRGQCRNYLIGPHRYKNRSFEKRRKILHKFQKVTIPNTRDIQKISSDGLLRKKQEYITNHVYCHVMYISYTFSQRSFHHCWDTCHSVAPVFVSLHHRMMPPAMQSTW